MEVAEKAALYFRRDPNDLREKIEFLEKNLEELHVMRKRAYEIYKERYTAKKMVEAFESLMRREIIKTSFFH
jgi:glycosyltransferase involved in cell wall biosynthesis